MSKKKSNKKKNTKQNKTPKNNINTKKVVPKKVKKEEEKPKKKIKLKFTNIILALLILYIIGYFIYLFVTLPITNIYIKGNSLYNDLDIIRIAEIEKYPETFVYTSKKIKSNLLKDALIKDVEITKKSFTKVYIEIEENYPIYFDKTKNVTYLSDGTYLNDEQFDVPILNNEIPKDYYDAFLKGINKVDRDILNRVSEIKYDPDSVDEERLLLTMNDGNYAYITMKKFSALNDYVDFVKEFDNKKGILYLNSGEYFKIFE
ncbi:MAG: FtsQ-type POTRA domain-containing protein [Bacilli bacterium]|nr:FtsQ-type POTRA domain-containing protein [Bacilli bacterium]